MPDGICSIPDCGEPIRSLTYCRLHYGRYHRWGDPLAGRTAKGIKSPVCSVEKCEALEYIKGYCLRHYTRWNRYGDPLFQHRPDPLESLEFFKAHLMTVQNSCKIWPYSLNAAGYGRLQIGGRRYLVHRLACEAWHGECPVPGWDASHGKDQRCESTSCWHGAHLQWEPHDLNMKTKERDGTVLRGEQIVQAKLTEANVLDIRIRRAAGVSRIQLAAEYNVHVEHIGLITRRKVWKHI